MVPITASVVGHSPAARRQSSPLQEEAEKPKHEPPIGFVLNFMKPRAEISTTIAPNIKIILFAITPLKRQRNRTM